MRILHVSAYEWSLEASQLNKALDIEQMEQRRQMNQETDVVYLLSPKAHIVDCLMADFERRRYRKAYLLWTSSE